MRPGPRIVMAVLFGLMLAERFFLAVWYAFRFPRCFWWACDHQDDENPTWMPTIGGGQLWVDAATCPRCKGKIIRDVHPVGPPLVKKQ